MPAGGSNPASAFFGTTAKPSLGPTFSYLVDATLWLAKAKQVLDTDREDLYIAEIFKSRKAVLSLAFTMSQFGVINILFHAGYRLVFSRVHRWSVQKRRSPAGSIAEVVPQGQFPPRESNRVQFHVDRDLVVCVGRIIARDWGVECSIAYHNSALTEKNPAFFSQWFLSSQLGRAREKVNNHCYP